MARLYGTLEGARGTASRTGTDLLRARLATWHAAVVVTLDDFGSWTVHTEPADPAEAANHVPLALARGNLHTGALVARPEPTVHLLPVHPKQSPDRRPPAGWTPYYREEPTA